MALDDNGHEVPDPRPISIPSGFKRPETLAEQVQRLVRTSISRQAAEAGFESFEESEDFDVDDDFDPGTPYETFFDPVLGRDISPQEFETNKAVYRQRYMKAQEEYFAKIDAESIMQENLARARARDRARERSRARADQEHETQGGGAGGSPPAKGAQRAP